MAAALRFNRRAYHLVTHGLATQAPITRATRGLIQVPISLPVEIVDDVRRVFAGATSTEILYAVPYYHRSDVVLVLEAATFTALQQQQPLEAVEVVPLPEPSRYAILSRGALHLLSAAQVELFRDMVFQMQVEDGDATQIREMRFRQVPQSVLSQLSEVLQIDQATDAEQAFELLELYLMRLMVAKEPN